MFMVVSKSKVLSYILVVGSALFLLFVASTIQSKNAIRNEKTIKEQVFVGDYENESNSIKNRK